MSYSPSPSRNPAQPTDDAISGVGAIADHIEMPETLTLLALGTGVLPGIKVGGIWTTTKTDIEAARAAAFANSNRSPGAPRGYRTRASSA